MSANSSKSGSRLRVGSVRRTLTNPAPATSSPRAELSLNTITEQQRVSSRYVQKLFEDAGMSFTGYVRDRRLERCRQELMSPAHRGLSVSEICFRWGFNDAAHFSRSFRAKFDMTPRGCRNASGGAVDA